MPEYLRPNEISAKIGTSTNFVRHVIGECKCREKKEEGKKTLFCIEDVIEFIRKQV